MPEPAILKINEIFWSFQGEGLKTGTPAVFLRLSGCSLRCPYCDTRDAWQEGRELSVAGILRETRALRERYPRSRVVITGGEPLEQDLSDLVTALKTENTEIAVETNGTEFQDVAVDWWTVSPKDAAGFTIRKELYPRIAEVKLLVNPNLDLAVVQKIRSVGEGFPIFLQPDDTRDDRYRETFALYRACQEAGIPDVRSGLQLHKIYGVQ